MTQTQIVVTMTILLCSFGGIMLLTLRRPRRLTQIEIVRAISRLPAVYQEIALREADMTSRVVPLDRRLMHIIVDAVRRLAAEQGHGRA